MQEELERREIPVAAKELAASTEALLCFMGSRFTLLDDYGLTRRQGDDRILVLTPDAARVRIDTLIRKGEKSS